jgi:hypothetical protein
MSAAEQQLIAWLREHKRRPTEFSGPATEAEVLEAKVGKTFNTLRFKAKGDRVSKAVVRELDQVCRL